jgi:hypothetical protein
MADPIPMILTCPQCGGRHVDEGEFAARPHHTHACQGCGMAWRPAVVHTVGVRFLPGFRDGPSGVSDGPVRAWYVDHGHEPLVEYHITIARNGDVTNDTLCHGNSFAEVYRGMHLVRDEVDRIIRDRRACPFNPKTGDGGADLGSDGEYSG